MDDYDDINDLCEDLKLAINKSPGISLGFAEFNEEMCRVSFTNNKVFYSWRVKFWSIDNLRSFIHHQINKDSFEEFTMVAHVSCNSTIRINEIPSKHAYSNRKVVSNCRVY
jgi:hypothetical protein